MNILAYLTNANSDGKIAEVFVQGNHEPRVHSRCEEVKEPLILIKND
jgi:hypothetical protein